jgi:N-acyl amino acid synthase of PEP-CTERM/exosortase system
VRVPPSPPILLGRPSPAHPSRSPTSAPTGSSQTRLLQSYNQSCDVRPAAVAEEIDQCLRLRYQVYCLENPFEDPAVHASERETDRYDCHSIHSLLRHKPTGQPIGTVRLILPRLGVPQGSLPIQTLCPGARFANPARIPWAGTAEVSRFCISKAARQRCFGPPGSDGRLADGDKELMPLFTLGLIRGLVEMSAKHNIRHWCIVVEPALLRFLKRLGLSFELLGPMVEHHGQRQPCHADLNRLLTQCQTLRPDVWAVITDEGRLWAPLRRPTDTAAVLAA